MNTLSFDTNYANNASLSVDVLSVFKQKSEKSMDIHQGMSAIEISDVVSEKIIAIVKEQFEATKVLLEKK